MVRRSLKEVFTIMMQIELNFCNIYKSISEVEGRYSPKLKTIAAILSREEASHYEWYKKALEDPRLESISILEDIYLVAKDNLQSFKESVSRTQILNEADIIKSAYNYEVANGAMLFTVICYIKELNISENGELLKFLEDLMENEETHAANLKQFMAE